MFTSAAGFPAPVGALAEIQRQAGPPLEAEVIGFRDEMTVLYPFSELTGVRHRIGEGSLEQPLFRGSHEGSVGVEVLRE